MTGNFKFKTLYNINNPNADKWYVRERNIKESPFEIYDRRNGKRKRAKEFFGLISVSLLEDFIMTNEANANDLFRHMTKDYGEEKQGNGSCELSTDRLRKMNLKEYIMLGLFLKQYNTKYNKKKDLFITKNKK